MASTQRSATSAGPASRKKRKLPQVDLAPDAFVESDQDGDDDDGGKERKLGLRGQKGLRHFSQLVCDKVEGKQVTTYSEVAECLVKELTSSGAQLLDASLYDEKNIRRRVYDALNVLMAIGVITKEKKTITWVGLPVGVNDNVRLLEKEKLERQAIISDKRDQLSQQVQELVSLTNLITRNAANPRPAPPEQRIQLPLVTITPSQRHKAEHLSIECLLSSDRREAAFSFRGAATVVIQDQRGVLQRLFLGQMASWDLARLLPSHLKALFPATHISDKS